MAEILGSHLKNTLVDVETTGIGLLVNYVRKIAFRDS